MARIVTTGLDDYIERLTRVEATMRKDAVREMLDAGSKVLVDAWKRVINERHQKTSHSGQMASGVKATDVVFVTNGGAIEVYPQGKDSRHKIKRGKGSSSKYITNAQKAYILHYGRIANGRGRKQINGDRFVDEILKEAEQPAIEAMSEKLNEILNKEM